MKRRTASRDWRPLSVHRQVGTQEWRGTVPLGEGGRIWGKGDCARGNGLDRGKEKPRKRGDSCEQAARGEGA